MGGALEYKFNSLLTGNFTLNKMTNVIQGGGMFGNLGTVEKDVNVSYSAGIKVFPYYLGRFGFYVGTGYMTGKNNSEYQQSLLGPRADEAKDFQGVYGSVGCRMIGPQVKYFTWTFDASINYNPGASVKKDYRATVNSDYSQSAVLHTKLEHGIVPTAYVGALF